MLSTRIEDPQGLSRCREPARLTSEFEYTLQALPIASDIFPVPGKHRKKPFMALLVSVPDAPMADHSQHIRPTAFFLHSLQLSWPHVFFFLLHFLCNLISIGYLTSSCVLQSLSFARRSYAAALFRRLAPISLSQFGVGSWLS